MGISDTILSPNKKCVVLGLDGVSFEMIRDLADRRIMPACADLLDKGTLRPMTASLPEISSVSWSSFMTGKDAGEHGIFGFVDLLPNSYSLFFPNFLTLKAPTIFDLLGQKKKRSVVINLPATYPARSFPGVLVSGFVALDLKKAVYPVTLLPYLHEIGYRIDVDASKGKNKDAEFFADLHYTLQVHMELARKLWTEQDWDLFMLVVTGSDRLHHFYYDAFHDDKHSHHQSFLDYYRQLDACIDEMVSRCAKVPDCTLLMLSDHGFGPIKQEVNLNPILKEAGFGGAACQSDFSRVSVGEKTKAFALDPSRIYLNHQNRFPQGFVKDTDAGALRLELREFFLNLQYHGQPVIKQVFFKEEVYHGPQVEQAADLILLSHPGFDLKGGLSRQQSFTCGRFSGMHQYDNAFLFCNAQRAQIPDSPSIFQVADLILAAMNCGDMAIARL